MEKLAKERKHSYAFSYIFETEEETRKKPFVFTDVKELEGMSPRQIVNARYSGTLLKKKGGPSSVSVLLM
jgi:hypothetical protein